MNRPLKAGLIAGIFAILVSTRHHSPIKNMSIELHGPQIIGAVAGLFGVLGASLVASLVARHRKLKIGEGSRLGLNLSTDMRCPACQEPLPTVRRPKNFRQMMWGGWTCAKCGSEFDKWLKPVDNSK